MSRPSFSVFVIIGVSLRSSAASYRLLMFQFGPERKAYLAADERRGTRIKANKLRLAPVGSSRVAAARIPLGTVLSAFICVHRRPIIGLPMFPLGPEEKHIWPRMNAEERR
jgi:hypothetical protein